MLSVQFINTTSITASNLNQILYVGYMQYRLHLKLQHVVVVRTIYNYNI